MHSAPTPRRPRPAFTGRQQAESWRARQAPAAPISVNLEPASFHPRLVRALLLVLLAPVLLLAYLLFGEQRPTRTVQATPRPAAQHSYFGYYESDYLDD